MSRLGEDLMRYPYFRTLAYSLPWSMKNGILQAHCPVPMKNGILQAHCPVGGFNMYAKNYQNIPIINIKKIALGNKEHTTN